jgi:pyruvate dehydrogenase E1 component
VLQDRQGPVIVATDYIRNYADQIREYVPQQFVVLGTDGFGRSDTRKQLRKFFEVNSYYITVAALQALAIEGKIAASIVAEAIAKYGIDVNKAQPWTV